MVERFRADKEQKLQKGSLLLWIVHNAFCEDNRLRQSLSDRMRLTLELGFVAFYLRRNRLENQSKGITVIT
jgi:hypothetical protein